MPRPMNVCGHNRLFYFFLMERALFDRHYLLTSAYVFPSGNSLWDVDRRVGSWGETAINTRIIGLSPLPTNLIDMEIDGLHVQALVDTG